MAFEGLGAAALGGAHQMDSAQALSGTVPGGSSLIPAGTGTTIGTALAPGVGTAIGAGVDLLSFGVGQYYNNKARNRQLKILKREQKRQEELQKQRIAFERQQAAFNRRMSRENLAMSREAQAFNQSQILRSNRNDSFDRFMQHIVNKMSVDQALRNKFRERGYI